MRVAKDLKVDVAEATLLVTNNTVQIYKYVFSWNTPNLNLGIPIVKMNNGDTLLDAWVIADPSDNFDNQGGSIRWDVGTFSPESSTPNKGIMEIMTGSAAYIVETVMDQSVDWIAQNNDESSMSMVFINEDTYQWQTKFVKTCTLSFVVSQSGEKNGTPITDAPVSSTTGTATLYLQISRA